jgi:DUF917 family protein
VLFKGKIIGVERVLRMGHAYGEVIIESTSGDKGPTKERMVIPFKNENIYAKKEDASGKGEVCFTLAIQTLCFNRRPLTLRLDPCYCA